MPTSKDSQESEPYAGRADYPAFPNPRYVSKFYVSGRKSGLTRLDKELYNLCYLPFNPFTFNEKREAKATVVIDDGEGGEPDLEPAKTPRPDYQIKEAPCKRTAAINANCHFQNTNGTFSGLQEYQSDFDKQQRCYCEIYPYFDSSYGCNECFRLHGGIEGYHWVPLDYMSSVSSAYCSATPMTTAFYPFISSLSAANEAAKVPSTTAPNVLGTQTEASLYWTYAAALNSGTRRSVTKRAIWTTAITSIIFTLVSTL